MKRPTYSCDIKLRAYQVREADGPMIHSAADLASAVPDAANLDREAFFVITLTQKNQIIDRHLISLGTLTAALVHPREVFLPAILDRAAAVAFLHNHPSSDTTPSRDDRELTTRLKQVAELLGFRLLDHVIVGRNSHCSFAEEGLL